MEFPASELILSKAGAVYHLNLLPEQIAPIVFLVGDPDRVPLVSRYFDAVWYRVQHREFVTHTGMLNGQFVSVVSTGIGTDNIDIVINELDALFNIDLITRRPKAALQSIKLIRLGTSGSLQQDVEVDSLLCSSHGLGLDGLMPFYRSASTSAEVEMTNAFEAYLPAIKTVALPYIFASDLALLQKVTAAESIAQGITLTCTGFYGPQGRKLRYTAAIPDLPLQLNGFQHDGHRLTNFEMETAGIYGLARILGHQALSVNAIIANRVTGSFSQTPAKTIDRLIRTVLRAVLAD